MKMKLKKSDYLIHGIGYMVVGIVFFTVLGSFIQYLANSVLRWPGAEFMYYPVLSIPYLITGYGLVLFIFGLVKKDKPIQVVQQAVSMVKK